jgi:hypothetical protein
MDAHWGWNTRDLPMAHLLFTNLDKDFAFVFAGRHESVIVGGKVMVLAIGIM